MTYLYAAILLGVVFVYLFQTRLYEKHTQEKLTYAIHTNTDEAFEDEDIYLYDELTNDKLLPLPFLKVNADLPKGLYFHFIDPDEKNGITDTYESQVQSIYVMQSYKKISRRWRVTCKKRGVYRLGDVVLVVNNLFGTNSHSIPASSLPSFSTCKLVVLPKPIDLTSTFVSVDGLTGDAISNHSLLTDPLMKAGTREYRAGDAMRAINWKSTAVHQHLMVNIEEHFRRFLFNIVINMQSRDMETHPEVPSAPYDIERCISVAATLLDRAADDHVPTRVIMNTNLHSMQVDDPESVNCIDGDSEIGEKIVITRSYEGRMEAIDALRMLAGIPMEISVPAEKMLDHILDHPELYTMAADHSGAASLIVISAYFCERMINFHRAMEERGIRVIYYITSANRNAMRIPEDIEIYFAVGSLSDMQYK